MPDGEMVINRGEYKRLGLFIWNGGAVFPGPGNYYAIATFSDAWTGDTNVMFTTGKRQFKAVEAQKDLREFIVRKFLAKVAKEDPSLPWYPSRDTGFH